MINPAGITIPSEQMTALVGKAIIDSLDAETRNTLIQAAITYVITQPPKRDSYRGETDPAPIEYAFREAMRKVATEVADEVVQEARPQIAEHLRGLLADLDYDGDDIEFSRHLMSSIIKFAKDQAEERRYR